MLNVQQQSQYEMLSIPCRYDWKLSFISIIVSTKNFQFPVGTIGSNKVIESLIDKETFQFLVGTIGSLLGIYFWLRYKRFQFLVGTIGRLFNWVKISDYCCLSIPCRYDWKLDYYLTNTNHKLFQFLVGTIGRKLGYNNIRSETPFNSL